MTCVCVGARVEQVVQDMHMHLGAQSFVSDDSSTNFQARVYVHACLR